MTQPDPRPPATPPSERRIVRTLLIVLAALAGALAVAEFTQDRPLSPGQVARAIEQGMDRSRIPPPAPTNAAPSPG